jgi:hypothetical protein
MSSSDDAAFAREAADLQTRIITRAAAVHALYARTIDPEQQAALKAAIDSFHYIDMMFVPRMLSADATATPRDKRIAQQNAEAIYRIADAQVKAVEDALRPAPEPSDG